MKQTKRLLGPLLVAILAGFLGRMRKDTPRDPWLEVLGALSAAEQKALESAPALAIANAVWAFGDVNSVKRIAHTELDRLPESEAPNPNRARVFLRFGLVDDNPDGQAAVFAQACASDSRVCNDHMKAAAEREVQARFVAPGNSLPLSLTGGHPHVPGPQSRGAP